MIAVLVVSIAIHAGLIATAFLADRPPRTETAKEIAVELVREAPPAPKPKPPEKPALKTAVEPQPKPAPPPPSEANTASKPEPVKGAEPPKPDVPKAEPPKAIESKAIEPKPEPMKASEPKPEPPPKAARPAKAIRTEPKPEKDDAAKAIASMEQELASLRAEQAALRQEHVAAPAPLSAAIGPHSFQAIALPSTSETGEATGYESLVFSQLYKAKEAHQHEGQPGTASVVFKVDDGGHLVDVAIATPSGIAALDEEALQVIREAAPFPPPPAGGQHDFSANVSFVPGAHY